MRKQDEQIKLLSPTVSDKEIKEVTQVLKSRWWTFGPVTEKFEREFAKYVGMKHAVAVNSGTSALHLGLKVAAKGKGAVIIPSLTFPATALPVIYEGLKIEFADIDEDNLCLDPQHVLSKIKNKPAAVIPVHFGGNLAKIPYASQVPVIEDCAHIGGSQNAGKRGVVACWSFNILKNIATGDEGMITTNSGSIAKKLKLLRWFGINKSTYERQKNKNYQWDYDISQIGYKYNTNDIMSAIAYVQFKRVKELNIKRKKIAENYNRELGNLPLRLPTDSESWHLYIIRVEKEKRDRLIDYLASKNISAGVHYKPLHLYSLFKKYSSGKNKLPVTEKVWREIVSLPIYPDLTVRNQDKVISAIKAFFKK